MHYAKRVTEKTQRTVCDLYYVLDDQLIKLRDRVIDAEDFDPVTICAVVTPIADIAKTICSLLSATEKQ